MSKDIKYYLHFYLGCECKIDGFEHHINGILSVHENRNILLRSPVGGTGSQVYVESKYIKPILRQLSDMTEEERKKYLLIEHKPHSLIVSVHFETMRDLLSKHFDLFGLIDAGLAIDKTKIP